MNYEDTTTFNSLLIEHIVDYLKHYDYEHNDIFTDGYLRAMFDVLVVSNVKRLLPCRASNEKDAEISSFIIETEVSANNYPDGDSAKDCQELYEWILDTISDFDPLHTAHGENEERLRMLLLDTPIKKYGKAIKCRLPAKQTEPDTLKARHRYRVSPAMAQVLNAFSPARH